MTPVYHTPVSDRSSAGRPSILVVDDHEAMRRCLTISLRPCYDVTAVETGEAAVELLASTRFDLVLTALQLPGMDGIDLCRIVKNTPETASTTVVLMTVRTEPRFRAESIQAGAAALLLKPFNLTDLHAELELLATHHVPSQQADTPPALHLA